MFQVKPAPNHREICQSGRLSNTQWLKEQTEVEPGRPRLVPSNAVPVDHKLARCANPPPFPNPGRGSLNIMRDMNAESAEAQSAQR